MLNEGELEEEFSCWKVIFRHLKSKGYDVYPPGIKEGECTSMYVAIRHAGISEVVGFSTDSHFYDIMLYLPHNRYSEIDIEIRRIKEHMDELFPLIRPTRHIDIPFWDYEIKAWQTSIEYVNYVKSKRR